jgi:hypothetical protein
MSEAATVLKDTQQRTLALMDVLGRQHLRRSLSELGWTFRFDRARKRLGACRMSRGEGGQKIISLSGFFTAEHGWELMEDVARHEIAHALDFETRGRSNHDAVWRAWAVRCGADPTRLYEGEASFGHTSRYVGSCPACGMEVPFFRRPRRHYACRQCSGRRYDARFRLEVRVRGA